MAITINHTDIQQPFMEFPHNFISGIDDDFVITEGVKGEFTVHFTNLINSVDGASMNTYVRIDGIPILLINWYWSALPGITNSPVPSSTDEKAANIFATWNAHPDMNKYFFMDLKTHPTLGLQIVLIPYEAANLEFYFAGDTSSDGGTVTTIVQPIAPETTPGHLINCYLYQGDYLDGGVFKGRIPLDNEYVKTDADGVFRFEVSKLILDPDVTVDYLSIKQDLKIRDDIRVDLFSRFSVVQGELQSEGELISSIEMQYLKFNISENDWYAHFGGNISTWLDNTTYPFLTNRNKLRDIGLNQSDWVHFISKARINNFIIHYEIVFYSYPSQTGTIAVLDTTTVDGLYEVVSLNCGLDALGWIDDPTIEHEDINYYKISVVNDGNDQTGETTFHLKPKGVYNEYWYYLNNFNCLETIKSNGAITRKLDIKNTALNYNKPTNSHDLSEPLVIKGNNVQSMTVSFGLFNDEDKRSIQDVLDRGWLIRTPDSLSDVAKHELIKYKIRQSSYEISRQDSNVSIVSMILDPVITFGTVDLQKTY